MDNIPYKFAESLLNLRKHEDTKVCFRANSLVYDSRNLLSLTAMENGCECVLWLDSDMVFEPDTLFNLQATMEAVQDCDAVTGVYFKRTLPTAPVLYSDIAPPEGLRSRLKEYANYPEQATFPVAGFGFGCVLMRTSLLERVWNEFGPAFTPFPWAGEDISFCYRAGKLHARMYCNSAIQCGHIGLIQYSRAMYRKPED